MTRQLTAAMFVLLCVPADRAVAQTTPPLPVFVYGRSDESGFVSPESRARADIARRVAQRLASRDVRIVMGLGDAKLAIQITDCELLGSNDEGTLAVPIGGMLAVVPIRNTWWTLSSMAFLNTGSASGYDRVIPFTAVGKPKCQNGEKPLAKQLKQWIADNASAIRAARTQLGK